MNITSALGGGKRDTTNLRDDWVKLLEAKSPSIDDLVWTSFNNASGWRTISSAETPLLIKSMIVADGTPSEDEFNITSLTFRYRTTAIADKSLLHPFLRRSNWRISDGTVLSDGNLGTTAAIERIPVFCTSLLIVHALELRFADDHGAKTLRALIKRSKQVSLGGFPIKDNGSDAIFVAPRYLFVADPVAVAAIIQQLPQMPNPSPNIEW